jgi:hypothetical protein
MIGDGKGWWPTGLKEETKTYEQFIKKVKMRFISFEQSKLWLMKRHKSRVTSSVLEYFQEIQAILSRCNPLALKTTLMHLQMVCWKKSPNRFGRKNQISKQ